MPDPRPNTSLALGPHARPAGPCSSPCPGPWAVLALALLVVSATSCARFSLKPSQPPQALPAKRLLRELRHKAQYQDLQGLAQLFTPHCQSSCTGYLPLPVAVAGQTVRGRWLPRLQPGQLLQDLAALLFSYAPFPKVKLIKQKMHIYPPGLVLVRAQVAVSGQDSEGRQLEDQGLVDLELRKTPAGWRVHRLILSQLTRQLTLLPGEAAPAADSLESAAPTAVSPVQPSSAPAATAEPLEPSASLPADPLALTVGEKQQPLSQLAGPRATVILLRAGACPACTKLCTLLRRALVGRPGVRLLEVLSRPASDPPCPAAPEQRQLADAATRALLKQLEPLLPLLAVSSPERPTQWLVAPDAAMLEAALDRLVPR